MTALERHTERYVIEKLRSAVECLATHPGDVKERLSTAYLGFHTLKESDFPHELKSDWAWVIAELNRYEPIVNHRGDIIVGSVEHTMKKIRRATGAKIAKRIFSIHQKMSFTYDQPER